MKQSEARRKFKEQKAQFAITGIPEEFNQHVWKQFAGMVTCKVCGLVKGSGYARCEKSAQSEGVTDE